MKKFFCKLNPSKLAFGIVIFTVISIEFWFIGLIGLDIILIPLLIFIGVCAIMFGTGYGLYCLIFWMQTKCSKN